MAIWSMLEPAEGRGPWGTLERTVAVREGWSWGAFIFGPLWLLWHRLWLVFLAWLAVLLLTGGVFFAVGIPDALANLLTLLMCIWLGLEATALRRWTLLRRGWRFAGLAIGRTLVEAESRFFASDRGGLAGEPPPFRSGVAPMRGAYAGEVIGMFPDPVPNGPGLPR